jgi:hypothetical protein
MVSENRELRELLVAYESESARLRELNEEIETNPNVDLLREVMRAASPARRAQPRTMSEAVQRSLVKFANDVLGTVVRS